MRSGLFLPIFDELADPVLVARLASLAEDGGLARDLRVGSRALA